MSSKKYNTKSPSFHSSLNLIQSVENEKNEQTESKHFDQIEEFGDNILLYEKQNSKEIFEDENLFFDNSDEVEANIELFEEEEKDENVLNFDSVTNIETNKKKKEYNNRSLIGKKRFS